MNAITTTWNRLARRTAVFVIGGLPLLALTSAAPGGSIFDDDYIPPKRVEPAPPPTTPAPTPSTPTPAPPSVTPAPPEVVAPKPAGVGEIVRHPVPDKASRAKCRKLFEEVFVTELKDRAPASRLKLAERLMGEAGKAEEGSPDRFVLLNGALQAGQEARSLRPCFDAAEQLALSYDVDESATKIDSTAKLFAGAPSAAMAGNENIEIALSLLERLVQENDLAGANKVATALQHAVAGISDPKLKTEAKDQVQSVAALVEAQEKLGPMLEALKKSPDDPAANLAVGSYFCFVRGQWDKGLPLLAKSGDASLKELATTELSHPVGADDLSMLAEQWVVAAAKLPASQRPATTDHAAQLYRAAEAVATGLQKMAIEKRLAGLPQSQNSRTVNLLPLFDPATSIVKGEWRVQDGALTIQSGAFVRVGFAYAPPEEYDFKISFTVVTARDCVSQFCPVGNHQVGFILGAYGNTIAGFEQVNGKGNNNNETTRKKDQWLVTGHHYVSVVKVRKTGVEAYLDGKLITGLKTDGSNLRLWKGWRLSNGNPIGIGDCESTLRFDAVEVLEITGTGKRLTPP